MSSMAKNKLDELWEAVGLTRTKSDQGFAKKSSEFVREMGRKGGQKAHENKTAHQFTRAEARAAGAKGLENRWAKWRAQRALEEAEFIKRMRERLASMGEDTGSVTKEQLRSLERESKALVRKSSFQALAKPAQDIFKTVMEGRMDAIERAIAPEVEKIAPTIDIDEEIRKLKVPLDQQILAKKIELGLTDDQKREARKEAQLAKQREEMRRRK